jgi:hypothetical protein
MMQEQLMLELFNGLINVQGQINETLMAIKNLQTKSLIETWSPLVTIIVGILLVLLQLDSQHKSNIETQNEKLRCDLRLQLRTDICEHIDNLSSLITEAGGFPNALAVSIIVAKADKNFGILPEPIPQRVPQFNEINSLINSRACRVMSTFEKYEIVCPNLNIFKTAIIVAMEDFRDVSQEYMRVLLTFLPFDATDEYRVKTGISVFNRPLPDAAHLAEIQNIGQKYEAVLHDFASWIYDLNIETQNLALGHLFPENKIPSRCPIDPRCIVIKTDKESIEKLTQYFENETAWGKNKIEAEKAVQEMVSQEMK